MTDNPIVFPDDTSAQPLALLNSYAPVESAPVTEKTGTKTGQGTGVMVSPLTGAVCPTGAHPGNTGGKPGRSGRPPKHFVEWCKDLTDDEDARAVFESRNKAGDLKVMEFAAGYAHGKPKESLEVLGKVAIIVGTGRLGVDADDDT